MLRRAVVTLVRSNHGRGHSYRRNGRKIPGVTTILGETMPKAALIRWAGNTTADYAADHWDELAALPITERIAQLRGAADAERDAAARRGTEVHRLAERLALGETVEVPEPLAGHVEAYRKFLGDFDPEVIAVELVVASSRPRYCGTADLVADMLGEVWLLELKTSRSGIYRESALQSCAYRRAEVYTLAGDDGAERPLAGLGIQRAGAVHIRSDGYDLRPLDTGDEVWRYFRRLAATYHEDRRTEETLDGAYLSRAWVGDAVEPIRAAP